jgi:succinate dehydrogenase/fumarate reductase flavoprotein subunit
MPTGFDETVDLLVVGAGAGGMTAALAGALHGLRVLLCEKTEMVGGITATSAGTLWIPGSSQSLRAGVPDSVEEARRYLAAIAGTEWPDDRRDSFLATGPAMLDALEARTPLRFIAAKEHPDYLGQYPGAAFGGCALGPPPFDGRRLGADFARIRPPRADFMVLGGMMVAKSDVAPLVRPFASMAAFRHAAGLLLRHGMDRLRHRRGTRLVMGNALVAWLFHALRERKVPIRFGSSLTELIANAGRVAGAVVRTGDGNRRIAATRGVVLATGGIGWNKALRERLLPAAGRALSLAPEGNTGDGLDAALRIGGSLDEHHASPAFWMPCSILRRADVTSSVFPHIVLDRAKPGLLAVDAAGRRFVNEADSYHDFVQGMLRDDKATPAYLICDRAFIREHGIGLVHPGTRDLRPFLKAGYLIQGDTPAALARAAGIEAAGLEASVAAYGRFATTGVDEDFGRGSSVLNRFNGDPGTTPNPCLRPLGPGPYFAVEVWPADLASSVGLRTDGDARVLDGQGRALEGLYACGNDMASVMRGHYPGPGTTIGPAMVFAWRAVQHASGSARDGSGHPGGSPELMNGPTHRPEKL